MFLAAPSRRGAAAAAAAAWRAPVSRSPLGGQCGRLLSPAATHTQLPLSTAARPPSSSKPPPRAATPPAAPETAAAAAATAAPPPLFAEFQPPAAWSAETVGALAKLRAQTKTSAIVEIKGRPYSVTVNDVVVTMRMNDLHLGDVISLDRVREISTEDYFLRGNPYIYPDFFSIKAVVIEHPVSAEIVRHHWKRRGHQPVHRNRNHYTALRISEIGFKDLGAGAKAADAAEAKAG